MLGSSLGHQTSLILHDQHIRELARVPYVQFANLCDAACPGYLGVASRWFRQCPFGLPIKDEPKSTALTRTRAPTRVPVFFRLGTHVVVGLKGSKLDAYPYAEH